MGSNPSTSMGMGTDSNFFRTHDPMSYIHSDIDSQSVVSLGTQANYSDSISNRIMPSFSSSSSVISGTSSRLPGGSNLGNGMGINGTNSSSYAGSIMTQNDLDAESAIGAPSSIVSSSSISGGGPASSSAAPSITYSQSDRLRRRLSNSSMSTNGDNSMQGYKSQASGDHDDDDNRSNYSVAVSQSSFTTF